MFSVGELYVSLIDNITYLILSDNNNKAKFFVCGKTTYQKYIFIQSSDIAQIALKINKKRYMKI
jgi:hypothetical protein